MTYEINDIHNPDLVMLEQFYDTSEILLFDIETTGFSPIGTTLYLIGCGFYKDNKWQIIQYFNDDGKSEKEILEHFFELTTRYKYLLNYNGDGFDIPHLRKKCELLQMNFSFENIESIDLYKLIRNLKNPLGLENLKQKTLEKFLGINRLDKYSGGDLIKVYNSYLKDNDSKKKLLLLQHNYEDIEGLIYCHSLMSYIKLKAGCITVRKMSVAKDKLVFTLSLDYKLPKRITSYMYGIVFTAYKDEATISAPIISDELKFFFDNYRDYYYLPAEDMAVHKSVATYVDKNYRIPATRENCYLKKLGHFISQGKNGIMTGYKKGNADEESYIELADSFLQDMDLLNAYARHIICSCLS